MRFLFAAAAALLAATPALATDWAKAAGDEKHSVVVLVDRDTLTRQPDGMLRVWVFYAFAKSPTDDVFGIGWHQEYDCKNNRYRRLYLRSYDTNGNVKLDVENVTDWKQSTPGDIGDSIQQFVCGGSSNIPTITRDAVPLEYARKNLLDPGLVQR